MSITQITGPTRVSTQAADPSAIAAPARQASAVPAEQLDELTQQPLPPRFPWLSRLSTQLEAASAQRAAFPAAPQLGDNLDKSA